MQNKYNFVEARQPFFDSKCCTRISNGCDTCNPPREDGMSSFSGYCHYLPTMSFEKILCKDSQNCKKSNPCKGKGFLIKVIIHIPDKFKRVKEQLDYKNFQEEYQCIEEISENAHNEEYYDKLLSKTSKT